MFNHNTKTYIMKTYFIFISLSLTIAFKTSAQDVKYVILKNNAANKAFFNEKDPNSFISYLKRQKQGSEKDLIKAHFESWSWLENGLYQLRENNNYYENEPKGRSYKQQLIDNTELIKLLVSSLYSIETKGIYTDDEYDGGDDGDGDDPFGGGDDDPWGGGNDEAYETQNNYVEVEDTTTLRYQIISLIEKEQKKIKDYRDINSVRPSAPNLNFNAAESIPEELLYTLYKRKELECIEIMVSAPQIKVNEATGSAIYVLASDPTKETTDYELALKDEFGNPQEVETRDTVICCGFDLSNIAEIIIKMEDDQITRISFAKKIKGRKKLDIVFSVDYESLMNPTAMQANFEHFENSKENVHLFSEKKVANPKKNIFENSLLGTIVGNNKDFFNREDFCGVTSILSKELNNDSYAIRNGEIPDYMNREMLDIKISFGEYYNKETNDGREVYILASDPTKETTDYELAQKDEFGNATPIELRDTITEVYWNKEKLSSLTDCYLGKRYYKDEKTGLYKAEVTDIVYAYKAKKGNKPIAVFSYHIQNQYDSINLALPKLKADLFMYKKWVEILKTQNFPSNTIQIDGSDIKQLKSKYHFITKWDFDSREWDYNNRKWVYKNLKIQETDEPHF